MTYPLGSLNDEPGAGRAERTSTKSNRRDDAAASLRLTGRLHRPPVTTTIEPEAPVETTFRFQVALLLGGIALFLALLALMSHDRLDPAFTTSGQHLEPANWVGALGAWGSDLAYALLGQSCWWVLIVGARSWLGGLALWLRRDTALSQAPSFSYPTWRFWLGVALLLAASCTLEWTRLYRQEMTLAGQHAGGILGFTLGPLAMKWLGFNGSGVVAIGLLVAGMAMALKFSWLDVAERIGSLGDRFRQRRDAQREVEKTSAWARKPSRSASAPCVRCVMTCRPSRCCPLVIETPVVEVPQVVRTDKEKQTALFKEFDAKLPQIDLLDVSQVRMEMITAESLEMTSRMIEKNSRTLVWRCA